MTDGYDYKSPIKQYARKLVLELEDTLIIKIMDAIESDIDRDKLIKALQYDRAQYDKGFADGRKAAEKHGYWSECYTDSHHYSGICSVCGRASIKSLTENLYDYCPRCGADMRGEPNE